VTGPVSVATNSAGVVASAGSIPAEDTDPDPGSSPPPPAEKVGCGSSSDPRDRLWAPRRRSRAMGER
jgi:hypothetical protein